jgi:hypothetical protein
MRYLPAPNIFPLPDRTILLQSSFTANVSKHLPISLKKDKILIRKKVEKSTLLIAFIKTNLIYRLKIKRLLPHGAVHGV